MLIRILHSFTNRSFDSIMNLCFNGNSTGSWVDYNLQTSISYLPTPPLGQDMTQSQFLSGV